MAGFERIVVWGGGAIGGTFAAHFFEAGHDVTVVDANTAHVTAISQNGLRLDLPGRRMTARLRAESPEDDGGLYDLAFLAVKADRTLEAARQLLPRLAPGAPVVSLQNGLCEAELATVMPPEDVVGAFINFGADVVGPGQIRVGNRGAVVVGETNGQILPRTREIHGLMALFDPAAVLSDNILGYLWGKQAYSATLKASALSSDTLVGFLEDPRWRAANIELIREVLAIAAREDIRPLSFDGFDPADFGADDVQAARGLQAMTELYRGSSKTHSSAWHDLHGDVRRSDARAQLAPLVEAARRHRISAPRLRGLVAAIEQLESFATEQGDETVWNWVRA